MLPPEVQAAIIALIVAAIGGGGLSGYVVTWFKNRGARLQNETELEKQKSALKAEVEAQNLKDRQIIRDMLNRYVEQIAQQANDLRDVRATLETANQSLEAMEKKNAAQEAELQTFRDNLASAEQTITELGGKILAKEEESRQRDEKIQSLTERLETVEKENGNLREQVEQRDEQLRQRDETHAQELAQRDEKIEQMRERLDKLEKKDTAPLDPSKAPDTPPPSLPEPTVWNAADTPDLSNRPEGKSEGEP